MDDRDGIYVYIQLTENKPREDVSVFLVLCTSKRTETISNFLFQPVISKVCYFFRLFFSSVSSALLMTRTISLQDCRLKLQPPSKCELPPYNPYIPAETIVQIMLIATPSQVNILSLSIHKKFRVPTLMFHLL